VTAHHHEHPSGDCRQILTQLNDYVDGALAPDLCVELEAHLASCDNCRVVLDTLNKTIYLVQQLDETSTDLPDDVEQRLFAVLDLVEFLPHTDE